MPSDGIVASRTTSVDAIRDLGSRFARTTKRSARPRCLPNSIAAGDKILSTVCQNARARDVKRTWKRSRVSFVAVILANLAALAVIWRRGLQAHALLIVYLPETGVIMAVYAAKINRAAGSDDPEDIRSRALFAPEAAVSHVGEDNRSGADALVLNYVGPWLFAGLFLFFAGFTDPFEPANVSTVVLASVSLVSYHAVSYWYEYVGLEAFERRGPVSLLIEPAQRIWASVLAFILGVGMAAASQSPIATVLVLLFFETSVDLLAHRRERTGALL